MWPSFRAPASRSTRSRRGARGAGRGFSVIEAIVSILILIVVLTLTLSLLFSMRSFAERQQFKTAPRQTARRMLDYISYHVQGASDLNYRLRSPNALVMYYRDAAGTLKQGSYNNVTDATLADVGTDILSLMIPADNPVVVEVANWTGFAPPGNSFSVGFVAGCNDDTVNGARFATASGGVGSYLTVMDQNGTWSIMQIATIVGSDCAKLALGQTDIVTFTAKAGDLCPIRPSSGTPALLTAPVTVGLGPQFMSFRVFKGQLEQKLGLFDAACDLASVPCPAEPQFTPVMENVVDFQVAYLFRDGTVWNTAARTLAADLATPVPNGIPYQRGNLALVGGSPAPQDETYDVQNVVGLRLSLIARSNELPIGSLSLTALNTKGPTPAAGENVVTYYHYAPDAEDHAFVAPSSGARFDYYRLTTTALLRNRMLGR